MNVIGGYPSAMAEVSADLAAMLTASEPPELSPDLELHFLRDLLGRFATADEPGIGVSG
jgi:hypothetical protein